ncbi:cell division protein FtsL [Malikia sp.]|uniref:cell division protein FtsL n=1 Tax=Malikia sp. TaxID=2070706 RepID=UPI002636CE23|nr:cell division protein FtsL [Malikia sp.]MDD2727830.1 cell division protein FtsL [Malikia sp.]
MTRVNLVLLLALLSSAFYLVHVRYESRRVYIALGKAQSQALRLETDHDQLLAQKHTQAAPVRVQQLAAGQLRMRPANPAVTEYVQAGPGASAKGQP